ncbi:MAG: hypothetical protein IJQ55_04720 [Alphaproteobacteria bacterium]|nr:hypothetical protein [Alphaproteobacteria bacterium]
MQLNKNSALERLAALGMDDMPVMEYTPKYCTLDADWFKKYTALRREFLSSLTDSLEEIAFMNLPQNEFINLVMGHSLPDNISVRLRIPLLWGGELSTKNMFLCWTFPHSHNLDRFIIEQSDAQTIYLPNPEKKVYLTTHTGGGGDGGNATSDRLSQIAFASKAGRGNE